MGLLKTVFEVNLGLFGKRGEYVGPYMPPLPLTLLPLSCINSCGVNSQTQRTLILFVIRDHVGTNPLSNLQAILSNDLHRAWDSLAKPNGLADRKLEDYFDLAFEALPNKVFYLPSTASLRLTHSDSRHP
jgi:hypothetical protein